MNLLVLLLIALPMCIAQFTIQGSSDGTRVAQGLVVEEGKGIRYTEQSDSPSGFSIQGSTDSHSNIQDGDNGFSNFRIQGATAGQSNYVVQGASDGANEYSQGVDNSAYNIQGATDGHSQSVGHGVYNPREKSLQYNDPDGFRVNWRSYDRQQQPGSQQAAQYSEAPVAPSPPRVAPHQQRAYAQPQPQPQPQPQLQPQQSPELAVQRPFQQLPAHIKQLVQHQLQIPYMKTYPLLYGPDPSGGAQGANQQPAQYQDEAQVAPEPRRPTYRGKSRVHHRQRRQAQKSANLPSYLQKLLSIQSQAPYLSAIPEQYRFNPQQSIEEQMQLVREHLQNVKAQPPRPPAEGRPEPRPKRQAPYPQPQPQQLPADPQLYHSTNIPGHLQQLIKLQAQQPYNIIPNAVSYKLDKTYVPQPIPPAAPAPVPAPVPVPAQQAQYQDQGATYQGQGATYQGQPSGYSQTYQSEIQYPQPGYQHPSSDIRPVTENQY